MGNPVWNLLIRVAAFAGCILVLCSAAMLTAFWLGFARVLTPTLIALIIGSALSAFSIIVMGLRSRALRLEMIEAIESAHRLSQGEFLTDPEETEIGEALKAVSDYMSERAALARKIAAGDLSANVDLRSDADKFGAAFHSMVERFRSSLTSAETRERLQHSVVKLLKEVSEVSAGDLTVQAEVGPEITGEIADAFNQMTRNLRSLIKQVKTVTMQVAASADAIRDTTEQLADGSMAQASQITRTTSAIADMSLQVREVSQNANLSVEVAANSLESAQLGKRAAHDNINAMRSIRKQVQETAKRIKKLGERAQEIGQITGMIDDLSDRTALLAVNASLRATSTQAAGEGFDVVAEEVERLAEQSNRLTQQIAALTQTINLETKEVVASMEETIREVTVGSAMADKAGRSLIEIEDISARLAELLRSISDSARFQAKNSEDISNSMSGISDVTALVQNGTKRAAEAVRSLVDLSHDLRNSVAPFKLPVELPPTSGGTEAVRFLN